MSTGSLHRVDGRMGAVRQRWHELVVKEALGTITKEEQSKLERYQVLVRAKPSAAERSAEAWRQYQIDTAMKQLKRLLRTPAHSSITEPSRQPGAEN